jgi:hypothetical protein
MITLTNEIDRYQESYDGSERFERFSHRRDGEFPVRSYTARTRGKMRSRATAAARRKARSFNGVNRRGTGKRFGGRVLSAF